MASKQLDPEDALAGPLYVVAGLLVLMPALDFLMSIGTPQAGSVQWRFATVGLLSGYTLTPILGFALALVVAAVRSHKAVQRILVVLCLLGAATLLLLLIGFIFDVLQLRVQIPAEGQAAFRSAAVRAALKHLLAALAFGYLGWRARRMIPSGPREKRPVPGVRVIAK